jgi:cytochrome b subunit of formate dehydrogenase
MVLMNMQVVRWSLDLAMGVAFLVTLITGFFKFTFLMQTFGLVNLVLPLARMSVIHDWAGLALGFFVIAHLYVNRVWIIAMTKKILTGAPLSP